MENECKVGIVILHYETVKDTMECIESINKNIKDNDVYIIVVDNGSKTGKLDALESNYANYDRMVFIRSDVNLGYAKGNNIGYKYAKEQLNCELIILANNDLYFEDENFIKNLRKHYLTDKFDVAGPKIISIMDGNNQNPVARIFSSVRDVKKMKYKFYLLYMLTYLNMDTKIIRDNDYIHRDKLDKEDFQLHGSCVILGNNYVKKFPGLCDKTFMYGEESILKYVVDSKKLSMKYFDDVIVEHKEATTTKVVFGKGKNKRRFYYKWSANGCKVLEQLMENKIKLFG